jgi:hypothetical protein
LLALFTWDEFKNSDIKRKLPVFINSHYQVKDLDGELSIESKEDKVLMGLEHTFN